jgi:hypothetical protein
MTTAIIIICIIVIIGLLLSKNDKIKPSNNRINSTSASELYSHYSKEEKFITLSILFSAATCDNEITLHDDNRINQELRYLNTYVGLFNSSAQEANSFASRLGPQEVLRRFISMDKRKTDEVLQLITGMLKSDGHLNQMELEFLANVLESLNISQDEFVERLEKLDALYNYFHK